MTPSSKYCEGVLFLLSSLVTDPSFMSISLIGSGVLTISFYKRLTGNPETGNTTVWVLPNIWEVGRVRDTKFGVNIFNERQGYSFYRFWVIKGKPTGGGGVKILPPSITLNSMPLMLLLCSTTKSFVHDKSQLSFAINQR